MDTYADVMDPTTDQLTTPGDNSMILPDSNYNEAVFSLDSLVGHNMLNGSVPLTDFNSMRTPQTVILYNSTMEADQMHIQYVVLS